MVSPRPVSPHIELVGESAGSIAVIVPLIFSRDQWLPGSNQLTNICLYLMIKL